MSYALFPQVAMKFFENRDKAEKPAEAASAPAEPTVKAAPVQPAKADNGVRTLYVEDLTEGL